MLRSVIRSFTISRVLVVLFALAAYLVFTSVEKGFSASLPDSTPWYLGIWYQWDANWYMSIIDGGYDWVVGEQSNVAFFPLYPLTVHVAGWLLGGRFLLAGMLLSSIYALAGFMFVYRLVREDYGDEIAGRTVWFLAIFPTAIFFSTLYTESLFLLTSVASFYYARRGRWAAAGIWGFLAALTRVTGLFLLIPLLWEYLSQRSFSPSRLRPSLLWLALLPAGLLVYIAYLQVAFEEPLAFVETQVAGWGHQVTSFSATIYSDMKLLIWNWEFWVIYELLTIVFFAAMIVVGYRKRLPASYLIYMALSLMIPMAGGTSRSLSRYILVVFPVFIIMAMVTEKRSLRLAVSGVSIVLLAISTAAFVTGRWVA